MSHEIPYPYARETVIQPPKRRRCEREILCTVYEAASKAWCGDCTHAGAPARSMNEEHSAKAYQSDAKTRIYILTIPSQGRIHPETPQRSSRHCLGLPPNEALQHANAFRAGAVVTPMPRFFYSRISLFGCKPGPAAARSRQKHCRCGDPASLAQGGRSAEERAVSIQVQHWRSQDSGPPRPPGRASKPCMRIVRAAHSTSRHTLEAVQAAKMPAALSLQSQHRSFLARAYSLPKVYSPTTQTCSNNAIWEFLTRNLQASHHLIFSSVNEFYRIDDDVVSRGRLRPNGPLDCHGPANTVVCCFTKILCRSE